MGPRMRELLQVSSLLHDIGKTINYYGHARHSAYLIVNSSLYGLSHKEQAICAFVAANSHGTNSKFIKASPYGHLLTADDRAMIAQVSLVLALAEAIDESHEQSAVLVNTEFTDKTINVTVWKKPGGNTSIAEVVIGKLIKQCKKDFRKNLIVEWREAYKEEIMALSKPPLYGAIHLGASSMSITIVEYTTIDEVKIIDYASRDVNFGEELFHSKRLSFQTIEEICRLLKGYKRMLDEYGVTDYTVYATAVVREAENRRSIMDQIFVQTGFKVEVVDMPKEIYYKYFGLYYHMMKQGLTKTKDAALFIDITSGGVGLTVWQKGTLVFQENVHLGTLRVMESFNRNQRSSLSFPAAVGEYLHSMLQPLEEEVRRFNVKYFVLSGDEPREIANLMGFETHGQELCLYCLSNLKTLLTPSMALPRPSSLTAMVFRNIVLISSCRLLYCIRNC